jgi:hypothetical protein
LVASQLDEQQSPAQSQTSPRGRHPVSHVPSVQRRADVPSQQSALVPQSPPSGLHAHEPVGQLPEQHAAPVPQSSSTPRHAGGGGGGASGPPEPPHAPSASASVESVAIVHWRACMTRPPRGAGATHLGRPLHPR